MKQAMKKWLEHHQITFDPNTANSICNKFGLDGEKADECIGLCYQLEVNKITQAEFTGGLCVITGKEPEEVMGILKGVKGTRPKMTLDELDKKAIALYIKRHGREAYESGEIGETLERIDQPAEEYDPVFLSKHPELKGKSITVYHDPLAGEDWAVVNNETGEVVEIFSEEVMGILKGEKPVKRVAVIGREAEEAKVTKGLIKAIEASKEAVPAKGTCYENAWRFQMMEGEGILVHGSVTGADGVTVKHAWVELDTGYVYEPQTKQFIKRDVFDDTFKPKRDAQYTVEGAAIMLAKRGYHGAWAEEAKPTSS